MAIEIYLIGKEHFKVSITVIIKTDSIFWTFRVKPSRGNFKTRKRRRTIKLVSACIITSTFKEVSTKYFLCRLPRITVPDQFLKLLESSLFWKLYSTVKMRKSNQSLITLRMKFANHDYDLVVPIGLNWHLGHLKP